MPTVASAALSAVTAKWTADHFALLDRMVTFGGRLQQFAVVVTDTDDANAAELTAPASRARADPRAL